MLCLFSGSFFSYRKRSLPEILSSFKGKASGKYIFTGSSRGEPEKYFLAASPIRSTLCSSFIEKGGVKIDILHLFLRFN